MSRLLVATLLILAMSFTTVLASSQTTLDTTPPEIDSLYDEIKNTEVILHARATDNESKSKAKYGDIDILFMYETSDTHYRDINGNPQPLPEGYKVHSICFHLKTF